MKTPTPTPALATPTEAAAANARALLNEATARRNQLRASLADFDAHLGAHMATANDVQAVMRRRADLAAELSSYDGAIDALGRAVAEADAAHLAALQPLAAAAAAAKLVEYTADIEAMREHMHAMSRHAEHLLNCYHEIAMLYGPVQPASSDPTKGQASGYVNIARYMLHHIQLLERVL